MDLEVLRYSSGEETTLGLLSDVSGPGRKFLCYTLEDEYRAVKVPGETRIPTGRYEVTLRTEGGKHNKYSVKYPGIHKGMLWIRDVPGFEYVLIHIGNTSADTEGCILLGNIAFSNIAGAGSIGGSIKAYEYVYPLIASRLESGERVHINIVNQG